MLNTFFFCIKDPGVQLWIVKNTANNNTNSNKQQTVICTFLIFLKSFYSFLQTIVAQPKTFALIMVHPFEKLQEGEKPQREIWAKDVLDCLY